MSKFNTYIDESIEYEEKLVSVLHKDCSKFLKETKGKMFYRGLSHRIVDYAKFKTKKDRKPRDTPLVIHNELNAAYKKKFGWSPRTDGVFTSTHPDQAGIYGSVAVLFPVGDYKYVYNPTITDILLYLEKNGIVWMTSRGKWDILSSDEKITKAVNYIVNTSIDKNLINANLNIEVVFKCKEYYLVNKKLVDKYSFSLYN